MWRVDPLQEAFGPIWLVQTARSDLTTNNKLMTFYVSAAHWRILESSALCRIHVLPTQHCSLETENGGSSDRSVSGKLPQNVACLGVSLSATLVN